MNLGECAHEFRKMFMAIVGTEGRRFSHPGRDYLSADVSSMEKPETEPRRRIPLRFNMGDMS